MAEWQPIETAPKSGEYIIVARFGGNSGGVDLRWVKHSRWISAEECASEYFGDPLDYCDGWTDGEDEDEECYPTHWMPLPPPLDR